jgi:hypothetical protein
VEGDVLINSETLLMTDFVNLKIKPTQSFGCAHRSRTYVRVFIEVSAHMCINICVYTIFLKKLLSLTEYKLHIRNNMKNSNTAKRVIYSTVEHRTQK